MALVAGVDSSTQSVKIEVRDIASGEIVAAARAMHPVVRPPCSEQDPRAWWSAFENAWHDLGISAVSAISVAGQQHGMVTLDEHDDVVHPAKLWNDTESSADAERLVEQWGGPAAWSDAVGSVPVAAFTITKLAWLRRTRSEEFDRVARVLLPHDYLTHRLTGRYVTDRGDASGTGYWSPETGTYRWDILASIDAARDWTTCVPTVLGPSDAAGSWRGAAVAAGTGDNMAAALGIGLRPGDAAISIGTSGTVFAVSPVPSKDPSGAVAGFADASGGFLPLVCTSNAAKVLDAVRRLLGVDPVEFDEMALRAGTGGPVLLPYFDGERTPNRPDASGVLAGLRTDITREEFARAAVDGVACGLLDGFDALSAHADVSGRVLLVGGGSRSVAMQQVLAGLLDRPVAVSDVDEAVATGAAVQAAAMFEQVDHEVIQHRWGLGSAIPTDGVAGVAGVEGGDLRNRYGRLRSADLSGL